MSRATIFQRACALVDRAIYREGAAVSTEERNKRVMAVEHKLREGVPADQIDTKATLSVISFRIGEKGAEPSPSDSQGTHAD